MGEQKDVLLENDSCSINVMDIEELDAIHNDSNSEIFAGKELRPYRFLQNCNFVGLWMCVLYNLCMLLIVVLIFIYKRWN
ncbi:uncharacterized protein LOC113564267 [Drosophila erecta]|uniref:uncharacterized protein LOC113564267 n=1 Tax=Drosophila erecta TaxID=7220 RepID=UPI000F056580|nr:uncharacterized protein LOC113564267 [Drosophila erecta]